MTAILLAVLLTVMPSEAPMLAQDARSGCSTSIPTTIRVFRIHRRGSNVPAHVDRVPFKTYVQRVMDSGAWPAYKPMESLKAGAAVIMARAWWFICHPQPGYSYHGVRYDIHDGSVRKGLWGTGADHGQYYRGPWDIHSKIKRAVDAVWDVRLRRDGRMAKPQWAGDGGRCGQVTTGNVLYEDGASDCAHKGHNWMSILRRYLFGVEVVR